MFEEFKCDHGSVMLLYEGDLKSVVVYMFYTYVSLQVQVYFLVYHLDHIINYKSISTAKASCYS